MNVKDTLANAFDAYRSANSAPAIKSANLAAINDRLSNRQISLAEQQIVAKAEPIVPQYTVQNGLRPLYGKGPVKQADIGDHPDFRYLRGTQDTAFAPITTLFMDIEGSTRLSLVYSLEEVRRIKNAFIAIAIEVAQAFDGHVHRIMGDAVMVFFGGANVTPAQAVIDALNCASVLRFFVDKVVVPKLETDGITDMGIRIGIDHGKAEDVLWSSYGYPGTCEVTATSYYVDIASKLQHSAGRNQIMVGDSLRSLVDIPDELLKIKRVVRDGEPSDEPFVLPNHTDRDGRPRNYSQYIFDWDRYLFSSPLAQLDKEYMKGNRATGIMRVTAEVFEPGGGSKLYAPTGEMIGKGKDIRFQIHLPYMPQLPYTLDFIVENHGTEAVQSGGATRSNHKTEIEVTTVEQHKSLHHWEHSEYRGLHYMIVRLRTRAGLEHETQFGVWIE